MRAIFQRVSSATSRQAILAVTTSGAGVLASLGVLFGAMQFASAQEKTNSGAPTPPAPPISVAVTPEVAELVKLDNVKARAAAVKDDYQKAQYDPIHFKPAIDLATDETCLVCHKEIGSAKPRDKSPAGVSASEALAWYQTLDTYAGKQEDLHWRHVQSPYAKSVMNLSCNFCHQGNDPREESPDMTSRDGSNKALTSWNNSAPPFTLRKMVNPSETCLRCHGAYPADNMGLSGTWFENRQALETPEQPNGCLSCHSEQFRTVRHQVNYLNAKKIEELAAKDSDVCYGCHGGRAWYRISYPFPRHPWPGMDKDVPEWAKDRPTQSDARFDLPTKAPVGGLPPK